MKIYKYNVQDSLILEYCRIITALEKKFSSELETMRGDIHRQILASVGVAPSGYRRDDREFMSALSKIVFDFT